VRFLSVEVKKIMSFFSIRHLENHVTFRFVCVLVNLKKSPKETRFLRSNLTRGFCTSNSDLRSIREHYSMCLADFLSTTKSQPKADIL
jgi:hypothetical protein